jgi:glyoxylase-like metal-dependent hydrolase (beta-lactamase superfamily II)
VGDHTTLIVDSGANAAAGATIYGYASIANFGNTLRVVNTEKHFDHIGGNGYFRARGIDVWGHAEIARTGAEFQAEIAEFNRSIPNRVRRELSEAKVFFEETRVTNPNRTLASNVEWDLGGQTVQILLTPGHTSTNISVWVPSERVLYSGDCLIRSYLPNLEAGGPDDWKQWLISIERIRSLGPHTIVCGHGPVASGDQVAEIIDEVGRVLTQALEQGCAPTI